MRVVSVARPGPEEDRSWDRELSAHGESTVFHSRAWARLVLASFPSLRDETVRLGIESEAGRSDHLLPLLSWRRAAGLFETVQSSFPFAYGGPVPLRDPAGRSVLPAVLAWLRDGRRSFRVTENPFSHWDRSTPAVPASAPPPPPPAEGEDRLDPSAGDRSTSRPRLGRIETPPGWTVTGDRTHLRTLPATDSAFWDDELRPSRRNDVRRLTKKGVEITEARSPEDIAAFYRLYLGSFERWGRPPAFVHPEGFYQRLADDPSGLVRFRVARFEGRVIGGTFVLRFGRWVRYLAGYFDPAAKSCRPNVLLQIDSIRAAIADGFAGYDFLPSGGIEPVATFKEGFGGHPVDFAIHESRSWSHRFLNRVRSVSGRG